MNTLGIECATDILSVALKTESGSAEASVDLGLKHAERLMGLVDFCLKSAGLEPEKLDLIACAEGPGSFTGLRIGMATVKGIALALGKPWVAVPTLDALAYPHSDRPGLVLPVIDGKKGRFYAALYRRGRRQGDWLDLPLEALLRLLDTESEVLVTGPDAVLLEETVAERPGWSLDPRARAPAAFALCALAEGRLAREGAARPDSGPLYLRPSEAEEAKAGAG